MDKNKGKVKLNDELLDQVSGGDNEPDGIYFKYSCSVCFTVFPVNSELCKCPTCGKPVGGDI